MQLTLKITQEIIDQSFRGAPGCCPYANAARQVLPPNAHVSVVPSRIAVYPEGLHSEGFFIIELPYESGTRIRRYDHGLGMEPHEVTLNVPQLDKENK